MIVSPNIDMNTTQLINKIIFPKHGGQNHLIYQDALNTKRWIDFSVSINPLGPSPRIIEVIQNSTEFICSYPDPESTKFKMALSHHIDVDATQLIITNGSTELIYLLPHLLKEEQQALVMTPIFSEYQNAFKIAGKEIQSLRYEVDKTFKPPLNKLTEVVNSNSHLGAVVIGHPNSPNGRLWSENELGILVKLCESKNIYLIIDETFIDFCLRRSSALDKYINHPKIILIRSMTKFFALPGIRLGYGIMNPILVEKLKSYQYPWSVNALAQEFGLASLKDKYYIDKSQAFVLQQREFLFNGLRLMPEIKVFPSEANFILIKLVNKQRNNSHHLYSYLLKEGIILRNCENFDGLDSSYFRIGIRGEEENSLLLSKLKLFFASQNEN
jgi:threonine-phosphate decarboxylase